MKTEISDDRAIERASPLPASGTPHKLVTSERYERNKARVKIAWLFTAGTSEGLSRKQAWTPAIGSRAFAWLRHDGAVNRGCHVPFGRRRYYSMCTAATISRPNTPAFTHAKTLLIGRARVQARLEAEVQNHVYSILLRNSGRRREHQAKGEKGGR